MNTLQRTLPVKGVLSSASGSREGGGVLLSAACRRFRDPCRSCKLENLATLLCQCPVTPFQGSVRRYPPCRRFHLEVPPRPCGANDSPAGRAARTTITHSIGPDLSSLNLADRSRRQTFAVLPETRELHRKKGDASPYDTSGFMQLFRTFARPCPRITGVPTVSGR